jgi:hypothetical protein
MLDYEARTVRHSDQGLINTATVRSDGDSLLDSCNPGVFTSSELSNFQIKIEEMVEK